MKDLTNAVAKRLAIKNEKKDRVIAKLHDYPQGFTIKEIAIDSKVTVPAARAYVLEMLEDGTIVELPKDFKSRVFISADLLTDKQEEAAKEEVAKQDAVEQEQPKVCAGREFKDPRSVTSVVAGDISWISSRSGNGLFFRYLILIVHSYKATCVNVFPEGHEAVNINDPNFIFVGTDPETEEDLYADLTNVCQRRFSAFGERCMHISPEHMENVKNRMARLLKVDIRPVGDQGTVQRLRQEGQKMADAYSSLLNEHRKLSDEYQDYKLNKEQYVEGLHQQFKGIIHEKKETDKANDELQAKLDASVKVIDKLNGDNQILKGQLDHALTQCEHFEDSYKAVCDEYQEFKNNHSAEGLTQDRMTDIYVTIASLKAQNEMLERHNKHLESIVYALSGVQVRIVKEEEYDEEERTA